MSTLNMEQLNKLQGIDPIDTSMVELSFQLNVNENQKAKGVLGKVVIFHPAFTTRATLFQGENGIRVNAPSVKTKQEKVWFNIVSLTPAFREYIIAEYQKELAGERNTIPWYEKMQGSKTKEVTKDIANTSLDITKIAVYGNLNANQVSTNMVASVVIYTSVATISSFSVYKSQYSQQLYGVARNEDEAKKIPAYSLTREAEAQVLSLIHPLVTDWNVVEYKKEVVENIPSAEEVENEAFDSSLYN